jgi:cytosine/adenosine deaminase-related metal-dependent hydrolase
MQDRRRLIRGGIVVTMDPAIGNLRGDILIEGDRIRSVAPWSTADDAPLDAEVIDASRCIVIPGLINAHMHTWQTALRGAGANWTLLEYFRWVHAGLATRFTPEDVGIATLAGALNQINCGTTTLVDWCHNNPTPDYTNEAVAALDESGIRAAFFHGSPKPDPKPGEKHFSEIPHPRREIERLLTGPFSSVSTKLSLGLAILGPHYSTMEVALQDFRLAKEFGLVASMHQGGGEARTPLGWDVLESEGLVGDFVNIVHGNDLSDERLERFVKLGVTFSSTPENEMAQGHGHPITGRLRALGAAPSLGVDLESMLSGDMFTVARIALSHQRALDNAAYRAKHGTIPPTVSVATREALGWITTEGARALKMQDRIGSLTPGKQADLVLLRIDDLNMTPVHDPVSTVVMQAGLANVDSVMIAGEWQKRNGNLLYGDIDRVRQKLEKSGRRILGSLGWRDQDGQNWDVEESLT